MLICLTDYSDMQLQADQTRDRLNQILCVLAVLLSVLASLPFVEAGVNDDWIYAHMALSMTRTGHFAYESATNATILVQTYLGSFLIHQFGFSFELLRFSTLPFAAGCGILCYRLALMAGLTSASSLFGSLTFVASPIFVPLAASFMSDMDACFFMLLSLYCGAQASRIERSRRQRILWLMAAVLAGYAGGLERQTAYFAPGSVLAWAMWRWRRDGVMLRAALCMAFVLGTGACLAVYWQTHLPIPADDVRVYPSSLRLAATYPARFILTVTLFILPAMARIGNGRFRLPVRFYTISALFVIGGFVLYWRVSHHLLFPWEPNMITQWGILSSGTEMRGEKPVVLNREWRLAITLAVLIVLVRIGSVLVEYLSRSWLDAPGPVLWAKGLWRTLSEVTATTQMLAIFGALNFAFLLVRSRTFTFDRYLLPLVPVAIIAALLVTQNPSDRSVRSANWVLLLIFSLYGIASTHDYFAALQARVTAFEKVEALGVAPRNIAGGLELDGWTQSEITSRVQSTVPRPSKPDTIYARNWFSVLAPDIDPRYYLSWSDEPGLKRAAVGGVSFWAWLPPFRREVKILVPDHP